MVGVDIYTSVMLHMNNGNAQTVFTDSAFAEHAVTSSNANHQISQSKFGGSSAAFNGTSSYLQMSPANAWRFGTGDFTIDFWIRPTSLSTGGNHNVFCAFGDDGSNNRCYLSKNGSNQVQVEFYIGGVVKASFYTTDAVITATNQWYHVALVRSGDNEFIFVDGVSKAITYVTNPTSATDLSVPTSLNFWIGKNFYGHYFAGYIDEFRISKGIARWVTNFTSPTSAYTVSSTEVNHYTKLMLHGEGTDASQVFTDSVGTPHTFTAQAHAQIDTADKKFGSSSILFDGIDDWISAPDSTDWNFLSKDWTIDFWIKRDGSQPDFTGIMSGDSGTSGWEFHWGYAAGGSTNKPRFVYSGTLYGTGTSVIPDLTWTHIAWVREGNNIKLYVNGTLESTVDCANINFNSAGIGIILGKLRNGTNGFYFKGWMDEIRITNGHARWTENFTPPTAQYEMSTLSIDTYTKMMVHYDGVDASTILVDNSFNDFIFVPTATAQIDTAQSKFGGASGLFDGNSDFFYGPYSQDIDIKAENFTIDTWIRWNNHTTNSGHQAFCARITGGTSYFYFTLESGTTLRLRDYNSGTNFDIICNFTPIDNTWYHIAAIRNMGVIRLYINGVSQVLTSNINPGNAMLDRGAGLHLGGAPLINYFLDGWMDEFRWSKGIARWWDDFTPPTEEYTISGDALVTLSVLSLLSSIPADQLVVIPLTVSVSVLDSTGTLESPYYVGAIQLIEPTVLSVVSSIENPSLTITSSVSPAYLGLTGTLLQPSLPGLKTVKNATKILSFNPLIIVMDTDPLRLAKVDISNPANPTHDVYYFAGVKNGQDITYDSITSKIYVTCADGKLVEIDANDFATYVVYDTGTTEDLNKVELFQSKGSILISSNYQYGEIIEMDNAITTVVSTDIRWAALVSKMLNYQINMVHAAKLDADIRWAMINNISVPIDIRFTNIGPEEYQEPISRLDFHVFINGVEASDVKMDSISIRHVESDKSSARFTLARQHDNIDYTLEGVYSQITNQNQVRVEIDGHIEFNGYIWNIDANSDNESVQVTAYTTSPKVDERSLVTLSLPSLDEKLSIHHALLNNPSIENPYILPSDENPPYYKGILVEAGVEEKQNISRWKYMAINGLSLSPTPGGTSKTFVETVIDGEFIPKQNWTYFWFASATNFITGRGWYTLNYIGTSPTALTGDTWNVTSLTYWYQRQFESKITTLGNYLEDDIGYYSVGQAPYKKVSAKSGRLVVSDRWVDNPDGLYVHRDESYDYRSYAQQIAALEYRKLQNINGTILPRTSATVDILLDAYYYYSITLLKRINIDNTVRANIYKNSNGFPLSVKSIEINSATMKVSLSCDNQWSRTEMLEIEASYPNPEDAKYKFPEYNALAYYKFDPRTLGNIE